MIKIKTKRKNPNLSDLYSIQVLKILNNDDLVNNRIENLLSTIKFWISGYTMADNTVPDFLVNDFLSIKLAFQPYIAKENKKIYRSVAGLSRKEYGYYSSLDLDRGYFQTALKPLQNWSYSKNFAEFWGSPTEKSFVVIFEASTSKNYNHIVMDPKSILVYFSKILKFFPDTYNLYKKQIEYQIKYLNSYVEELLLYSPNGEIFIDKIYDIKY
jgi:hypothetical protein